MKQLYEVEIAISNRLVGRMEVTAESEEEAEDLAAELIKLTAKPTYDQKTQTGTSPSTTGEKAFRIL